MNFFEFLLKGKKKLNENEIEEIQNVFLDLFLILEISSFDI